jgi:hypothetical protein
MARRFGRLGQWPWRLVLLSLLTAGARAQEVPAWFAPAAVAVSADGRMLYAAGCRSAGLLWIDTAQGAVVREARLPGAATGLGLDEAGGRLIVTYSGAAHGVVIWPGSRCPPPRSSTGG